MPLPFILGGLAIAAGLGGATAGVKGVMKMSDAKDTLERAKRKYESNKEKAESTNKRVQKKLDLLGKKQLEVAQSFKTFVYVIENIQSKPKMKDLSTGDEKLSELELEKIKEQGIGAEILLGAVGGFSSGTLGALAASGATTTAVMALGTASTGTAISGLTGVAATNATLAALGGGSIAAGGGGIALGTTILGGATLGVGLLVGGIIFNFTGDKALEKADEAYRESSRFEEKVTEICGFLEKLEKASDKYMDSFEKIAAIYYKNLYKIKTLVEDGITDFRDFRRNEIEAFEIAVNSCSLLRAALKIKLAENLEKRELNRNFSNEISKLPTSEDEIASL